MVGYKFKFLCKTYLKFVHPTRTDSSSRLTFSSQILYLFVHVMWLSQKKNYNMRAQYSSLVFPQLPSLTIKVLFISFTLESLPFASLHLLATTVGNSQLFCELRWLPATSVTRKMKNLEAADLLQDSISDNFCRKTNLKKIIAKAVSWVSLPKTLHFLWLKGERIWCYFGNTNIRPVFRMISVNCLFLPHPRSTVAVRFGLILLRISLFRDFTCNLSIFQEQLLSISRLYTVAKFSLDLECSVSVRKRLIPF